MEASLIFRYRAFVDDICDETGSHQQRERVDELVTLIDKKASANKVQ